MAALRSIRVRIVLLVVVAGVVPLGIVGYWLARGTARAGERIVRERLVQSLDAASSELAIRWTTIRSDLLAVAESSAIRGMVAGEGTVAEVSVSDAVQRLVVVDSSGARSVVHSSVEGVLPPSIVETIPIYGGRTLNQVGDLEAAVSISSLIADAPTRASALGSVVAAIDRDTGASLLSLPFAPGLLETGTFQWAGETWISERRPMTEPSVLLVTAAPVTPMTASFEAAAREGILWLMGIAAASIGLAILLTGRLTASLRRLASAATAVSRGDLSPRVDPVGRDEVGQVAGAFNLMTENLRRTLRELADRQALAAVGEFAASLSHEIRNALTAIRLDLQVAEEALADDSPAVEPHRRALDEVGRLDQTVTGALDLARSGKMRMEPFDLVAALEAAIHSARPEYDAEGVALHVPERPVPLTVRGDAAGMEQLFLNVLLNAAQATPRGGSVTVRAEVVDASACVTLADTGPGIPDELKDRIFEPFYSTREDGTGLGLPIARRIARAHGGTLRLEPGPSGGTVAEVAIPLVDDVTG